ncbi:hypothetical protein [Pseudarthrobacter sp. NIBRBAC000502770]|uniref:hypothetical protein n=1 Tax=Pseudarthrobacter sp. NIBRBAC000502770 TaxID=2590785 RepID=UPI00113FCCB3|nr:hypothetical protein [Pseudarthrobacter sp. NIBRBAC000502770]QDG87137.1 hypothetical protein NIBR502770_00470 [Pseudarthrobacter sp. NIBRBAC000502770]
MQTELTQGTPVRYWPGFRDGASKLGRLRSGLATIGGTPGYYVTGAGFISGGHIEPLPLNDGVIEVATGREALEVCGWEGVTDVVVTDNAERIKLEKLMRGLR